MPKLLDSLTIRIIIANSVKVFLCSFDKGSTLIKNNATQQGLDNEKDNSSIHDNQLYYTIIRYEHKGRPSATQQGNRTKYF